LAMLVESMNVMDNRVTQFSVNPRPRRDDVASSDAICR
jgi:hypothetical protein